MDSSGFLFFVTGSPRRVAAAAAAQAAQRAAVQLPQWPQLKRAAAAEATAELCAAKEAELRGLRAACEAWQFVLSALLRNKRNASAAACRVIGEWPRQRGNGNGTGAS